MTAVLSALRRPSKTDTAAILCISAAFIYIIIMAFFNGTFPDEAFYISIPLRLINGDGLFTDEWHLSQLSAVLLYVPVSLFTGLTGGTEGIVLFMRVLFCLMQLGTGVLLYTTLRDYGLSAALISSFFMSFFAIGINTLSYNTIGVASLFALICVIYRSLKKPSGIKMLCAGSLTAAFVLCQPFAVFLYLAYFTAVCVFFTRSRKEKAEIPFPLTLKAFFLSVAGILPVLIFFLYLLLKNSDISTIISCIPGILNDVEHMQISENLGIKTFSLYTFFVDMTMCMGTVPLILYALSLIAPLIIRKKSKSVAFFVTAVSFAVIAVVFWIRIAFMRDTTETDDVYFYFLPLALPGIVFYVLSEKKNKPVFILFWCTGIIYALFMTASSNMRLHASVNGYIIAAAGTLLLGAQAHSELKEASQESKFTKITAVLLSAVLLGSAATNFAVVTAGSLASRFSYTTTKMTEGMYKGILFPSDQALKYTKVLRDTEKIKEILSPEDKLFVLDNIPTVYVEGGFNMGAFSGWFISDQLQFPEIRDRFREYYSILPENIPDYIYVPSSQYSNKGGLPYIPPKKHAEFAGYLFEGEYIKLYDGLLIKVTGIKND